MRFLLPLLFLPVSAYSADANLDGMDDGWQNLYQIAAFTGSLDPDGDGRPNLVESLNWSNPLSASDGYLGWGRVQKEDLNNDLLHDSWAAKHMRNGTALIASEDTDGDNRTHLEESILGTDPWVADSPWQSLYQPQQPARSGGNFTFTEPSHAGMRYRVEVSDDLLQWTPLQTYWGTGLDTAHSYAVSGTMRKFYRITLLSSGVGPLDTDGDGLSDWHETQVLLTDPANTDTDQDGLPDGWEAAYGLNPSVVDSSSDEDGDGLTAMDEFDFNRDPRMNDITTSATSYTYTNVNRLITASTVGGSSLTFTYDAEGNLLNH